MNITAAGPVTSCPVCETTVDAAAVLEGEIIDCQSASLWRRLLAMTGSYKMAWNRPLQLCTIIFNNGAMPLV